MTDQNQWWNGIWICMYIHTHTYIYIYIGYRCILGTMWYSDRIGLTGWHFRGDYVWPKTLVSCNFPTTHPFGKGNFPKTNKTTNIHLHPHTSIYIHMHPYTSIYIPIYIHSFSSDQISLCQRSSASFNTNLFHCENPASVVSILSSGWEGANKPGYISIFPLSSLWNGEPRSYLEFPNYPIANELVPSGNLT